MIALLLSSDIDKINIVIGCDHFTDNLQIYQARHRTEESTGDNSPKLRNIAKLFSPTELYVLW